MPGPRASGALYPGGVRDNPFGQVLVALVTPFRADGEVDWDDVERLIDDVVTNGADGIVVSGTTG